MSPNGKNLLFVRFDQPNTASTIIKLNLETVQETELTGFENIYWHPTWSPDGQHIAFISNRDGDFKIYRANADGTNIEAVRSQLVDHLAWSPAIGKSWHPRKLLIGAGSGFLGMFGLEAWRHRKLQQIS